MKFGVIFLAALGAVVAVVLLLVVYLALRAAILVGRKATFGAWMITPGEDKWVRGICVYGELRLAWFPLVGADPRPEVLLPRTVLEVVGAPIPSADNNYIIVRLRAPAGLYMLALSAGDSAGLISWVNSAPPGIDRAAA